MQTKNGSSLSYEDFEPFCNWRRNDESETLVVHLPAFRKDQLKIQVYNSTNTVKISGERLVDATKRSRFHKEIAIPKDCKSKEIHAKFADGLLHVVIPKKGPPAPQQELVSTTTQIQQPEASKQSAPRNISQDQVTKLPTLPKPAGSATEKIGLLNNGTLPGSNAPDYNNDTQMCDSGSESLLKTATNVAAMVALLACLGAYIMYSYRSLYIED
ncbi:uncharacterized protein LOC131318495 [Rhododendron vialii]|uniref:uncharacterized protein LOC131318495 n=1 Tax=Rhododendron vialii TaxID=182163 RepID=UPI00265DB034|nr:uncharacterized protein LOC131318495 [Rhododendron vialii]